MNRFALITVQLISIFSIVGFLAAACQSKQVYEGSSAVARNDAAKPSAEMNVEWLKNKDGRIDLMI